MTAAAKARVRQEADTDIAAIALGFSEALASQSKDIGEVKGQLRELIHTANNTAQKLEAIGMRLSALEGDKLRRDGAISVWQAIMNSKTFGIVVVALLGVAAYFKGKGAL